MKRVKKVTKSKKTVTRQQKSLKKTVSKQKSLRVKKIPTIEAVVVDRGNGWTTVHSPESFKYIDREIYSQKLKFQYDSDSDCGYIYFSEVLPRNISKTVELDDFLLLDLNDAGKIVGIEVLGVLKHTVFQLQPHPRR